MKPRTFQIALVVVLSAACQAQAQDAKAPYPHMAPLDQYLMERDAEVALARTALLPRCRVAGPFSAPSRRSLSASPSARRCSRSGAI